MSDFFVMITDEHRADVWEKVLGSKTIAVKSPLTKCAFFPGDTEMREYYELDLSVLSAEQRFRLIDHLSCEFRIKRKEVERDLDAVGVPILAADCILTVSDPGKWFS